MYTKMMKQGNTVIEVLVATVIVGLILTALAISMTSSIQNSSEAQYRETGTSLAQDTMEVFRKDKNIISWTEFSSSPGATQIASATIDSIKCVPTTFTTVTQITGSTLGIGQISSCASVVQNKITYKRAISKVVSTNSVRIKVHVYWNVGTNQVRSTSIEQTFYKTQ